MSATAEAPPATTPITGQRVAHARADAPDLVPGRRSFFTYRDLGVTGASAGRIRAQVTIGKDGMTEPTGWHVHLCEGQFIYMLSGWVTLDFADRTLTLRAGDSLYIPGDTPHNETAASPDLEILEVSVPADMGTRRCDPPAGRG
ncbi:MAG: cupin domain-containing protein [Rhodospirillales bacterium]|nr:cupin domain-containing protein [Rhodospirillales bacterium]